MSLAVEMVGISKRFGSVQALDSVDIRVEERTIHALVGENGAGKTTLMRVLYGALHPDGGTISLNGKSIAFHRSAEAIRAGIGMVSQHYAIIPQLDCLDNLMLGAEAGMLLSRSAAKKRASQLAQKMGFEFDWDADASTLSPAGAQKLEILKLLWRKAKVMILDEPTAMLSPSDSDALYASLKQLTADGATIIIVTHRLPEVLCHCDQVTVLRGGVNVAAAEVKDTTGPMLAEWIVGRAIGDPPEIHPKQGAPVALEVRELTALGDRGNVALKGISFELMKGELLGIAGVDGSGQRELFQALLGLIKPTRGRLVYKGSNLIPVAVADRIKQGFRIIVEDRHEEGVIDDWSLLENASLGLQRLPKFQTKNWIQFEARLEEAKVIASRFSTKHGGLSQAMSSLSGGNQQRFVAGRALSSDPNLILAFQPSRGLDIAASRELYGAIREECAKGASAIVVSFDLDELLENCDRIVAMCNGSLYEPLPESARDRSAIGRLMVGAE